MSNDERKKIGEQDSTTERAGSTFVILNASRASWMGWAGKAAARPIGRPPSSAARPIPGRCPGLRKPGPSALPPSLRGFLLEPRLEPRPPVVLRLAHEVGHALQEGCRDEPLLNRIHKDIEGFHHLRLDLELREGL